MFFQSLKRTTLLLSLTCATVQINAAHWQLISFSDVSYSSSSASPVVVRGTRDTKSVTMPAGSLYGTGPFNFYGERASFSDRIITGNPGLQIFTEWSEAYYEFKYKWVADTRGDVPPNVNDTASVFGYSLERCVLSTSLFTPTGLIGPAAGIWAWAASFNSTGPTWGGTSIPNYYGMSIVWPLVADTPNVVIGTDRFYVRPGVIGSGIVGTSGSDIIFTATVINHQSVYQSTPVQCADPSVTNLAYDYSDETFCYKGAASFLGIPVL